MVSRYHRVLPTPFLLLGQRYIIMFPTNQKRTPVPIWRLPNLDLSYRRTVSFNETTANRSWVPMNTLYQVFSLTSITTVHRVYFLLHLFICLSIPLTTSCILFLPQPVAAHPCFLPMWQKAFKLTD